MSVRSFFQRTSHNCLKVFKNWTTSIQNRRYRKRFSKSGSMLSMSTHGRGSVSTEITVLDYDLYTFGCQYDNNEINENRVNECIEKRKFSI
ncbi:hypothetical protein NQ315_010349 [Exocentrus adspersus]|uniref:Uncharacterized protein n=1 Tax=Exocentrus adspersus TaxID=1586481 RepID=A0AAV8WC69_9CUCU|nr:hypothetical protein NQ315_010349 [Exocentrus adspersus]